MPATTERIRVLHVDDEPDFTELASTFLERADDRLTVHRVQTASEGLDYLAAHDVDCIVSDYDMPGRSGIDFLDAVRDRDPALPFILYTGKGSEEVAAEAISADVTDYLQKEQGTEQYTILANRVVNAVERHRIEHAADRTRTQLEAISENSADAIVIVDTDSHIHFANPAVEDLFGYTPDELHGEQLTKIMPERYRDAHLDAMARYVETDERSLDWSNIEFPGRHADGTEVSLSLSFSEFEQDGAQRFIGIIRDISNQTRMEEAVREREERFRQVADNIQEVVWMSDPDKEEMVYVNPAYEDVWGRTVDSLYADPSSFLEAIHPDDRERVQAALDRQLTGDYDEEYRIIRPNGDVRWIQDQAVPVTNDAGDVTRIVGIATDITARKEQERKRERIIGRVTDAIVEVDADWRFTLVNEQAEDLYDMTEEELLGRDFWEVFAAAEGTRFEEEYRRVMETREPTSFVEYFSQLDGWFDIEAYPTGDGGVAFYFIEVTDQREREHELEETNALLATLFEAFPHGILVEDDARDVLAANHHLLELFGIDEQPEELIGTNCARIAKTVSEHVVEPTNFVEQIDERIETREPVDGEELALADGRTFERTYRPIDLPDGPGNLWIYRDVTDRAHRERELERSRQQYSALAEHFPNGGVFLFDTDLRYQIARGEGLEDMGFTPDDFEGCRVDETFGGTVPDPFPAMCRAALEGETRTEEITYMDRTFRVHTAPVREAAGEIFAGLAMTQDITAQKAHERRLEALTRATRELLAATTRAEVAEIGVEIARDVLDLDANSIHLYDEDTGGLQPIATTESITELIGEPPTFTDGESIAWRVYEHGEPVAIDDVQAEPDVHNPETSITSELYLPLEDHGVLLASSSQPAAFDHEHLLLGELLASNVATALTQIEQTAQLRARERELTRQNDRLEEFARVVSHDLRNPLNVAQGALELASEDCTSDHLEKVTRAHDRMNALITDLLTLAREGSPATELSAVTLSDLAVSCWQTVETTDATLHTEVDRTIRADARQLRQLFENLFRNSVEHGGPSVTVTVGGLEDGFYVEDDGPGIPAADRDQVFGAGYSTNQDGTGFGLSIVKQIVEAHDWDILVTDGTTGGARFQITGIESPAS